MDAANSNPRYPNTIVLTPSTKGLRVSTHVPLGTDSTNGLREASWVKREQVLTISKERLLLRWGHASPSDFARIEKSVMTAPGM